MEVIIRQATIFDSSTILSLIQELADYEKEPESVKLKVADIERYGFDKHPMFKCLVAEIGGKVIGMALYYQRFSTWRGPTLHLEDLIVTDTYKGRGIGSQLYTEFIKIADEMEVERIEWNVLDWNSPAIKFYEKSGATILHDWSTVQMHKAEIKTYLNRLKK